MDFENIINCIDRDSPVPLYHQLKQVIMKKITSGEFPIGMLFPSEAAICSALKISRPTVRQALSSITADGYLVRRKGKGTFVTRPKLEANFVQKLESFHIEMQNRGIRPSTRVLRLELVPPIPLYNEQLQLAADEPLIVLERLCLGDEEPVMYQISYLPGRRFGQLVNVDMSLHSLYNLLFTQFDTKVQHVHRQIEAINANQLVADLLDISRGQAVCRVHNLAYDHNKVPVECNVSYYRGDRNKFTMDLFVNT